MGKRSGISWLSMVKRVFRSPSKDRERKRKEEDDEEKKVETKTWIFRKFNHGVQVHKQEEKSGNKLAAEVAAEEIGKPAHGRSSFGEIRAAIVIQKAFKGFVARRALRAFKGVVKLQALVRGQNVRRQAKVALRCMQALVRVQDRIRNQRGRLSLQATRNSTLSDINSDEKGPIGGGWVPRSSQLEEWDSRMRNSEEAEAMAQWRKEAAMKREKALAYAFSRKIWSSRRFQCGGGEEEVDEQTRWLERWMATKQWDNISRTSSSERRDGTFKTVEHDSGNSRSSISAFPVTPRRTSITPPNYFHHVRSASPRSYKEERSYSVAPTPRVPNSATLPNYMTATESAKARARCVSTPRQRAATPEREHERQSSARKRLIYTETEPMSCYTDSVSPCSSRY